MESAEVLDPLEVSKTPKVIKDAQEEIGKLDVLICGLCHEVFHFAEALKDHRESGKCSKVSTVRDTYKFEPKAQVWAFMLWKNAQLKKNKESDTPPTSWVIYQRWCKLKPEEKEAWVVAGQTIQSFTRISTAKMQEIRTKTQQMQPSLVKPKVLKQLTEKSKDEEPLEEGEIRLSQLTSAQRIAIKAQVANRSNVESDSANEEVDLKNVKKVEPEKKILRAVVFSDRPSEIRKGLRTLPNDTAEEALIEKILNRRFNPKRKCIEYFIKWENMKDVDNTWEPRANLDKCKALVEEFDRVLAKPKIAAKPLIKRLDESHSEFSESEELVSGRRPQRTSKQKALNQVKVWCGDITDGEESGKRKLNLDDDDSSDSFEKKIKMEEESESSEEEKPFVTYRKLVKTTPGSLNGVAKKQEGMVTSTPQRVVRVSQKQLPNLSSGVYIMSKTDGIIKLDTNSTSINPLLKVGQKIGQTHIKVIKKDLATGTSSGTPTPVGRAPLKPGQKLVKPTEVKTPLVTKGRIPQRRMLAMPVKVEKEVKKLVLQSPQVFEDDESDGLEELAFPTDLPLPSPDSPPGEFTLCPLTGKIIGQTDGEQTDTATSLDNLVKEAVADLPDVDLAGQVKADGKNVEGSKGQLASAASSNSLTVTTVESATSENTSTTELTPKISIRSVADIKSKAAEERLNSAVKSLSSKLVSKSTLSSNVSILNAALTSSRMQPGSQRLGMPKKLISTNPHSIRQKITSPGHTISPIGRVPRPTTTIIHKVTPGRHRPVIPKPSLIHREPQVNRAGKVTTYKPANIARRIGNTTIYKSEKPTIVKSNPITATGVGGHITPSSQPTAVINMPLLTNDEEQTESKANTEDAQPIVTLPADESEVSDLATFSIPETDTPLLITGEDGTIYQVAGQNEEGQTILISQGPDGQQQCVLVSSDAVNEEAAAPVAMDVAAPAAESDDLQQALTVTTQSEEGEAAAEGDGEEAQVVAQIIKADPPSPGGTRKVVLMLPDGNLMMTDVTAEQYAALELDK